MTFMALLLLAVLPGNDARATSFVDRPFEEAVEGAPMMARGRIGMKYGQSAAGSDGRIRIYTYYDFQVSEVFKGAGIEAGRQIKIRELGGEANGVGLQVAGSATFDTDEDVVVMLGESNPDGSFTVRGMMTGKYGIEKDSHGIEHLSGAGVIPLAQKDSAKHDHSGETEHLLQSGNEKKRRSWSLFDLRKLVREQRGDAPVENKAEPKPTETPTKTPSAAPAPSNSGAEAARSAPRLQNEESEEPSGDGDLTLWALGGVAILLIGAAVVLRNPRR